MTAPVSSTGWSRAMASAIRDPDRLIDRLGLDDALRPAARRAAKLFPLLVPESYVNRMRFGDPDDPLLRQVLPLDAEHHTPRDFSTDPLAEEDARTVPGLLQKYRGRALLITTGACAIHCRYCFRRHYPYASEPKGLSAWEPALEHITRDETLTEVILSGGDPLMLTDAVLGRLLSRLNAIPHLKRLRIHTRLPIVLPERITGELLSLLTNSPLQSIVVVHANHARELEQDCPPALQKLRTAGIPVLNQAVLLGGINATFEAQRDLCERLVNLGVLPYYLHQLDRVTGTAHFEVSEAGGLAIIEQLREHLPGYAVPRYVREIPGEPNKTPLM